MSIGNNVKQANSLFYILRYLLLLRCCGSGGVVLIGNGLMNTYFIISFYEVSVNIICDNFYTETSINP